MGSLGGLLGDPDAFFNKLIQPEVAEARRYVGEARTAVSKAEAGVNSVVHHLARSVAAGAGAYILTGDARAGVVAIASAAHSVDLVPREATGRQILVIAAALGLYSAYSGGAFQFSKAAIGAGSGYYLATRSDAFKVFS